MYRLTTQFRHRNGICAKKYPRCAANHFAICKRRTRSILIHRSKACQVNHYRTRNALRRIYQTNIRSSTYAVARKVFCIELPSVPTVAKVYNSTNRRRYAIARLGNRKVTRNVCPVVIQEADIERAVRFKLKLEMYRFTAQFRHRNGICAKKYPCCAANHFVICKRRTESVYYRKSGKVNHYRSRNRCSRINEPYFRCSTCAVAYKSARVLLPSIPTVAKGNDTEIIIIQYIIGIDYRRNVIARFGNSQRTCDIRPIVRHNCKAKRTVFYNLKFKVQRLTVQFRHRDFSIAKMILANFPANFFAFRIRFKNGVKQCRINRIAADCTDFRRPTREGVAFSRKLFTLIRRHRAKR